MQAYLVECYWPGVLEDDVDRALGRLGPDAEVAALGTILVSADEIVLSVFEAASPEQARSTASNAGFPVERIVECVPFARAFSGQLDT